MSAFRYMFCPGCKETTYTTNYYHGDDNDFIIVFACRAICVTEDFPLGKVEIYDKEGFFTRKFDTIISFLDWSKENKILAVPKPWES